MPLLRVIRQPIDTELSAPLVVLLHGLGSDEQDLIGLADEFTGDFRVVSFRAPYRYQGGGFAWFSIDWNAAGIQVDLSQLESSTALLMDDLEHLRTEFLAPSLYLGGFSQGAIMSLAVACRRPMLLNGLFLMSGRNVPELISTASVEIDRLPCIIQHGTHDPVLPVEGARQMYSALTGLGVSVEYHEYAMAHQVSPQSLADLSAWLDRQMVG